MEANTEKSSLRKVLLERRDSLSYDFIQISSKQIFERLRNVKIYANATNIAAYYPIGSEVKTQDIMQEILSQGKTLLLPKVVEKNLCFKKISSFEELEKGMHDIMEPKDSCPESIEIDVAIVPTVGITASGIRLGYGYGYYDRFLSSAKAKTIALTYSKQIVKSIPFTKNDVRIDWIVSENEQFEALPVS